MYRYAGGYVHHEYATVKSMFLSLVRNVDRAATWRCECHSVVSSKRSEPSHTTHAWLFQCKSMHRETGERQWTTEIASSLVAVAVHRCTEERKSTGSW